MAVLILVTEWQGVEFIELDRILVGEQLGTGIWSCLVLDFGFGLSVVEYVYSSTTDSMFRWKGISAQIVLLISWLIVSTKFYLVCIAPIL